MEDTYNTNTMIELKVYRTSYYVDVYVQDVLSKNDIKNSPKVSHNIDVCSS